MPRIKRYTKRLSFHVKPEVQEWFEEQSELQRRPASELYREALEKFQAYTTRLQGVARKALEEE